MLTSYDKDCLYRCDTLSESLLFNNRLKRQIRYQQLYIWSFKLTCMVTMHVNLNDYVFHWQKLKTVDC